MISQKKLLNNVYCFVVVFSLQFKQLQRVVVTMALKSLYRVCEIEKMDLIFSSFSVRSQNHSYKNSIVLRLALHLCSSTSLVARLLLARSLKNNNTCCYDDNVDSIFHAISAFSKTVFLITR